MKLQKIMNTKYKHKDEQSHKKLQKSDINVSISKLNSEKERKTSPKQMNKKNKNFRMNKII